MFTAISNCWKSTPVVFAITTGRYENSLCITCNIKTRQHQTPVHAIYTQELEAYRQQQAREVSLLMFILGRGVEQFRAMLSACYQTQQFPNCMSPSSLCCTTTDRSSMQLPTASTVTTSTHVTCLHCAICDMRANRRFCADRHTTCRYMFAFMGNLNAYRSPGMISANLIRALATQVTIPITALQAPSNAY